MISYSEAETKKFARELAQKYKNGRVIALTGNLGAGKTTFVQGFAEGLGITQNILSPTFVLIRQYDLPDANKGKLYHLDLYRLEKLEQIEHLGVQELFENPRNIVLIEWAERMQELLPQNITYISLEYIDETSRELKLEEK